MTLPAGLADAVHAALPQTQCSRCGYPDCRGYAEAIVADAVPINQCPPGGQEGIARLARLTGRPESPLNPHHGIEAPRQLALIDESWCIGCTLCLKACPVDCIVGGPKLMHTVIAAQCTGCELCIPACPVDCISLRPTDSARTGWGAWSAAQADEARDRYAFRLARLQCDALEQETRLAAATARTGDDRSAGPADARKSAALSAALARSRAARAG